MVRVFLTIFLSLYGVSCFAGAQSGKLVVLFTSDLHSHLLPYRDGSGGAARLKTIVNREKELAEKENAAFLLLDGGDIAMGSIFHTLFSEQATEYRAMAGLGYDAFTFGNHDFDFGIEALEQMFAAARNTEESRMFPTLLSMNLHPMQKASEDFPIKGWTIFERNGIRAGVFGLMGENSYNVIGRDAQRLEFTNPAVAAREAVKELQAAGVDYIIALSHGGTMNGDDLKLAREVEGIDLIISAHDHDLLAQPIFAGKTSSSADISRTGGVPIVAAGAFGKHVGKVVFSGGRMESYTLIEVGKEIPQEPSMARWVDSMYNVTKDAFVGMTGADPDDTLATGVSALPKMVGEVGEMPLGSNIAASYSYMAGKILGGALGEEVIGVVPYGVVRRGLDSGAVTVKDVFEVLSLGENEAGHTGYPLVYAWLNGKEIADLCELSVSVSPFMEDVRLFFSGVEYSCNPYRPPFFKVGNVKVSGKPVEKGKLYPVVTGQYTAGLIGLLEKESYGLLSAVVKDSNGNPLDAGRLPVLRMPDGRPVTGWMAFAEYVEDGRLNAGAGCGAVVYRKSVPGIYAGLVLFVFAVAAFIWRRKSRI